VASLRAERELAAARVRRARLKLGLVAGVVLAVIALLLALAGGRPVPPGRSAYDAGTTDPVAAAVPPLAGFAEQARGLRFGTPPKVQVAELTDYYRAVREPVVAPAGDRAATRTALGLGPAAAVAYPPAFYSVRRKTVLVQPGPPVDAVVRTALVGALTQALQDQAYGLAGLTTAAAADPDRARALAALVEGDAARVRAAYVATLPAAEQAAVRAAAAPAPTGYGALEAWFPAAAGASFVTALAEAGGNAAVDAAFRRPPTSTAQVLDPAAYRDGREPLGVDAPPGEGTRVDAGTLGQFGLAALVTGGVRVTNAGSAGQWRGDSYGTFRAGRSTCTYVNVVLADPDAREQLVRDLARWAAARKAQVSRSAERGVRIRACVQ
jgi:hypothetical protein